MTSGELLAAQRRPSVVCASSRYELRALEHILVHYAGAQPATSTSPG
ncbi:hypothetical protein ABZ345_06430 [Lentzea sp. NPDC005914]